VQELGLPFWLAGGFGVPGGLREALAAGAAGIQVGTLFAFCDESGFAPDLKASILSHTARGAVEVFTDPLASPTGFPFKTVRWAGDPATGTRRSRICDLGYLRSAYRTPTGDLGYRCPSEPVDAYAHKGGSSPETQGRTCLCNALMAGIGHGQVRANGAVEPPIITTGDGWPHVVELLAGRSRYSAADVIEYLGAADGSGSTR
jgi:NAD(P)H-dependent flavin oxidoreductase YrpB (nitropropane dioxygenase family)